MTVVVDASVVVAALVDHGHDGSWASTELMSDAVVAPHVMPAEVANVLRKSAAAGTITGDTASVAHHDLLQLPIALFAYEPFASRVWELRVNLTAYDAWYVALAEQLDAPLVTLDRRLAAASGPTCAFRLPPL